MINADTEVLRAMTKVTDVVTMHAQLKARGIDATSRRFMVEFQQMIDALPEDADQVSAIHDWASEKIKAKFSSSLSLSERYPGVADVAAKYTPPEAGYYSAVHRRSH